MAWDLPFGKGKKFLGSTIRSVNRLSGLDDRHYAGQYTSRASDSPERAQPTLRGAFITGERESTSRARPFRTSVNRGDLDPRQYQLRWINRDAVCHSAITSHLATQPVIYDDVARSEHFLATIWGSSNAPGSRKPSTSSFARNCHNFQPHQLRILADINRPNVIDPAVRGPTGPAVGARFGPDRGQVQLLVFGLILVDSFKGWRSRQPFLFGFPPRQRPEGSLLDTPQHFRMQP